MNFTATFAIKNSSSRSKYNNEVFSPCMCMLDEVARPHFPLVINLAGRCWGPPKPLKLIFMVVDKTMQQKAKKKSRDGGNIS